MTPATRAGLLVLLCAIGATADAGEPQGNALHFAKTSNRVMAGQVGLPFPSTIELWARYEPGGLYMVGGYNPDFPGNDWGLYYVHLGEGSGYHTFVTASGTVSAYAFTPFVGDRWQHVAVVLSADGFVTYYIKGSEVSTGNSGAHGALPPIMDFAIGNDAYGGYNPWKGAIDEVRIWNVARTPQEIRQNRGIALTGTETGLVSYHRLDQGTADGDNTGVTTATKTAGSDGTLLDFVLTGTTSNWVEATWALTPPTVANPIDDQAAREGQAFGFEVAADAFVETDTVDTLTFSAQLAGGEALPAWLSFEASTRTFSGTPADGDADTVSVEVIAADGDGLTASDTFDIEVADNSAPTLANAIPDQEATEDVPFSFAFEAGTFADDADDTLIYSAAQAGGAGLPTWLTFTAATRTFAGTPANDDVGELTLRVTAVDSSAESATDDFVITVANVNDPPVVGISTPGAVAVRGRPFLLTLDASAFWDVDAGDALTLGAALADGSPLPAWLAFDPGSRTFSGTPVAVGDITLRVTATDLAAATATDDIGLSVRDPRDGDGRDPWYKRRWDEARGDCGSGSSVALLLAALVMWCMSVPLGRGRPRD